MTRYFVGLDVSEASTSIGIVDERGELVAECVTPTDPASISKALAPYRRRLAVVAQETGGLSVWLHRELQRRRLPIVCLDARTTRAALLAQRNKTDRNDARDIAVLLSRGFKTKVHVKSEDAHRWRLLLTCRRTLKRKANDLQMTLTRTIKVFGLTLQADGELKPKKGRRVVHDPLVDSTTESMVRARKSLLTEIELFDQSIKEITHRDPVCQRLMTVPGVGPLTALTFRAAVDDPSRFSNSRVVAAHFGLTPRRIQSGQSDFNGRVSKLGDQSVRATLYEAAIIMLVHSRTQSKLREWGLRIVERRGYKFAAVACARKLAVLMHRLWVTEKDFQPGFGLT